MPRLKKSKGNDEEIRFEVLDAEIFRIPDDKTRLTTLQGYFFPRLERLLRTLSESVRETYDVDPYEVMAFAYRPAHRKDAASVKDFGEVYIGLTPGRSEKPLHVFHPNGTPYQYHPACLVVVVDPEGALQASFRPYGYNVDTAFRKRLHRAVSQSWDVLGPVLEQSRIASQSDDLWMPIHESLLHRCSWDSPPLHFPLSETNWLGLIEMPFVAMYPLLDTSACLALGKKPRLRKLLAQFQTRREESLVDSEEDDQSGEDPKPDRSNSRPIEVDLDGYRMIRNGLWYQILARDKFTCCACKRSAQEHGVVLHVDHIVPRSKGGSDDPSNLQALCMKCNTGKSNRDQTRLTSAKVLAS